MDSKAFQKVVQAEQLAKTQNFFWEETLYVFKSVIPS